MTDHGTDCPCPDCDPRPAVPGCLAPILWLAAMLGAWCWLTGPALGQPRVSTDVLVARTLVSEEGWDGGTSGGWASLGAVMRGRAARTGGDLRASVVALSPRLHADPCTVTSRRWRCSLGPGLDRPAGLRATWDRPRAGGLPSRLDAWTAALEAAASIVAGTLPDACATRPRTWGSHLDVLLRVRAGERWIDAECPGRNRYGRRLVRAVDPE